LPLSPGTPLFNVVLIETVNTCTRECWFCKFGQRRQDDGRAQMDWATIRRILENLRDLNYGGRISWFWINEPLLDTRMGDILELTRELCPRAFLSLITNGDLLDDTLYRELRARGLDALGVSIYDDRAMARIQRLQRDERLVILDMRQPGRGQLENRAGNIHQRPRTFAAAQRRFAAGACERPSTMLTINPKGQVVLCCSDMYSDVVMGDVHSQRLEEIWNCEAFQSYRVRLQTAGRRGLKLCDGCSYSGAASPVLYPLRSPGRPGSRTDASARKRWWAVSS